MVKRPQTFAELKSISDEELVRLYDSIAQSTQIGLNFIAEEIRHRDQSKINRSMQNLTWVIVALTALNTVFVFVSAYC